MQEFDLFSVKDLSEKLVIIKNPFWVKCQQNKYGEYTIYSPFSLSMDPIKHIHGPLRDPKEPLFKSDAKLGIQQTRRGGIYTQST